MAKISAHGDEKLGAYVCRVPDTDGGTLELHYVLTNRRLLVSYNNRKSYKVSKQMRSAEMLENYSYRLENTCERLAR